MVSGLVNKRWALVRVSDNTFVVQGVAAQIKNHLEAGAVEKRASPAMYDT